MEAVSASPYTVDVYRYCQLSIIVESAVTTSRKVAQPKSPTPERLKAMRKSRRGKDVEWGMIETANNLTLARRIEFALQAARGVRDLHAANYSHEDLKPSQFLVSKTGQLKLNDFNRARRLEWDPTLQRFKPYRSMATHSYAVSRLREVQFMKFFFLTLSSLVLLSGMVRWVGPRRKARCLRARKPLACIPPRKGSSSVLGGRNPFVSAHRIAICRSRSR